MAKNEVKTVDNVNYYLVDREVANERDKERKRLKYHTDPEYREMIKKRTREYRWKKKQAKLKEKKDE